MSSKKLVLVEQNRYRRIKFAVPFNNLINEFQEHMHNAGIIVSTYKRKDGNLIYNTTKEQDGMCAKVPDYEFVGFGKWEYR